MASPVRFRHSHGFRHAWTVLRQWELRRHSSGRPGPLAAYNELVKKAELKPGDLAQERAVQALDKLHQDLCQAEQSRWWRSKGVTKRGLYLHGTVGTGKTFLMDLFYNHVPVQQKSRMHFHSFMLDVHKRLHKHGRADNAVQKVASQLFEQAHLLCLDELEVTDVADALMLKRLFEILWPMGMIVVATSNTVPDLLYKNGLNRHLFLPFISQLKEYCNVYSLNSVDGTEIDYRRRHAQRPSLLYNSPLRTSVDSTMDKIFLQLTGGAEGTSQSLKVAMGRQFSILSAKGIARASFSSLCESALGAADYFALAGNFKVLLIDRIPQLGDQSRENSARRFITLVDVLYEANTVLICSASVAPDSLFLDPSDEKKKSTVGKKNVNEAIDSSEDDKKIHIVGEGGASGRSTLMIGNVEWSATGRVGASLASLAGGSFTKKATIRAVSRLLEMQSDAYISKSRMTNVLQLLEQLGGGSGSSSSSIVWAKRGGTFHAINLQ